MIVCLFVRGREEGEAEMTAFGLKMCISTCVHVACRDGVRLGRRMHRSPSFMPACLFASLLFFHDRWIDSQELSGRH